VIHDARRMHVRGKGEPVRKLIKTVAVTAAIGAGLVVLPSGDAGASHSSIRPGKSCREIDDRDARRACIHALRHAKKAARQAAH
jgi:hypothetical protein